MIVRLAVLLPETTIVLLAVSAMFRAVVFVPTPVYCSVPPASVNVPVVPMLLVPLSAIVPTLSVPAVIVVPPL